MRLDKWLWAARFFKTRTLASEAVQAGHVHVNGARAKPSKELRVGDTLTIKRGQLTYTVVVSALAERRGPASAAKGLYEESVESIAEREKMIAFLKATALPDLRAERRGRPSKRDRRRIEKLRGR